MAGSYSPPGVPTRARRGRRWPWVLFAFGVALGLTLEGFLAFGIYTAVRQFGRGTCLPSDLPAYQGASTTGLHVYTGTGGSSCDMTFDSADSASQVFSFYDDGLAQGDWEVVSASVADGTITFRRHSDPGVHGQVRVLGRGVHSSFEVVLQTGS